MNWIPTRVCINSFMKANSELISLFFRISSNKNCYTTMPYRSNIYLVYISRICIFFLIFSISQLPMPRWKSHLNKIIYICIYRHIFRRTPKSIKLCFALPKPSTCFLLFLLLTINFLFTHMFPATQMPPV